MYPGTQAALNPERPAVVMSGSGEVVTYRRLDETSNRLAHLFRAQGLERGDHIALFCENHPRFFEVIWAALRSGLYVTAVNSHLTAEEVAYIVGDCGAEAFVATATLAEVATTAPITTPTKLMIGGAHGDFASYEDAIAAFPATPIDDESSGTTMLYSSGTTGRPKGVLRPLPEQHPAEEDVRGAPMRKAYRFRDDMVYLSPAPIYHAAPLAYSIGAQRVGGTVVMMERFDPEAALAAIEHHRVTHSQWVPTMFVRLLRLPPEVRDRYDLSTHEVAIHAAAPCPVPV
jgi:acyl-CoA synthetase (AMP-forming)/AMP-acid ligase II